MTTMTTQNASPLLTVKEFTQAFDLNWKDKPFRPADSVAALRVQLLLEEIRRIRAEGVDREIFTLCKNEKYGQLIENLENVEDSASQMADRTDPPPG